MYPYSLRGLQLDPGRHGVRCSVKGAPGCSSLESAKDALALKGGEVCGARILKQHLRTATENTHRKHSRSTSQSSPRNCEVWFTTDQALHKLCTPDDSFLNNTTSSTTCVFGRTADSASSISRARTARRLNERISRSGRYCDSSTEPLLTSPVTPSGLAPDTGSSLHPARGRVG